MIDRFHKVAANGTGIGEVAEFGKLLPHFLAIVDYSFRV